MPFLAAIPAAIGGLGLGGAAAAGAGAAAPSFLSKMGGFLGDNAGPIIGGIGSALQGSGPQVEPFQGGSSPQNMMDEFLRMLRGQVQRQDYLSNQPKIAYGLPGMEQFVGQQQSIPGLDVSLGFSPALMAMYGGPRMISPGLDAAYWDQSLPASQRKESGDEPWRQIADSLMGSAAYSPIQSAAVMPPPQMPAPQRREPDGVGQENEILRMLRS